MTSTINEYRAGLKIGPRSEFFAIADVIPGKEEELREQLAQAQGNPDITAALEEIGTLHEARFLMLDGDNGRKKLAFASSFDGPWDTYIDDFARTVIGQAFHETWIYAVGFPGIQSPDVKKWFKDHTVVAGSFNTVYPGPTAKQIVKALAVNEAFQQVLDDRTAVEALQHPALKPLLELAAD